MSENRLYQIDNIPYKIWDKFCQDQILNPLDLTFLIIALILIFKEILSQNKNNYISENFINNHLAIKDLSEYLFEKLEANRLIICKFKKNLDWDNTKRFHLDFLIELCKKDFPSLKNKYDNIEIDKIYKQLSLYKKNKFLLISKEDIKDEKCIKYLNENNIQILWGKPIYKKNRLGAILEMHFNDSPKIDPEIPRIIKELEKKLCKII